MSRQEGERTRRSTDRAIVLTRVVSGLACPLDGRDGAPTITKMPSVGLNGMRFCRGEGGYGNLVVIVLDPGGWAKRSIWAQFENGFCDDDKNKKGP